MVPEALNGSKRRSYKRQRLAVSDCERDSAHHPFGAGNRMVRNAADRSSIGGKPLQHTYAGNVRPDPRRSDVNRSLQAQPLASKDAASGHFACMTERRICNRSTIAAPIRSSL